MDFGGLFWAARFSNIVRLLLTQAAALRGLNLQLKLQAGTASAFWMNNYYLQFTALSDPLKF
jgi:hypothetical protein